MKHQYQLCILACLMALQGGTWAQTSLFSQEVRHDNIKGQEIITRSIPYGWILTCSKSAENGNHTFSFHSPTLGISKYFTCNLGNLFSTGMYDYSIKDMYIFENKCYFCGTYGIGIYENIEDPEGNTRNVPNGFVGYFKLFPTASIATGTEGEPQALDDPPVPPLFIPPFVDSIYLMKIPYTDSIMQIVAHHDDKDDYDVFLMAVAYASSYYPPTSTCVVELKKPLGTSDTYWKLSIVQPTCAETDEYLTDIVLTEDHVVVASKLEYADGGLDGDTDPTHYLFRLHEAKRDGFYNTTLPFSSASVYAYDVSPYGVGIGCHHKGDAIRLCPMDGNRFCVYYHGERHEQPSYYTGVGGPVLFWMNGAQLMEHAAKNYGLIYSQTKEAVWIGDSYKTIAMLLSCTFYYPEGAVLFPTLHPNPFMSSYGPCLAQRMEDVDLHSIDCNPATQYLYIAGTDASKKLWHGIQDEANYCDYMELSCLDHNSGDFVTIDPQEATEEYCQWSIRIANESVFASKAKVQMVAENPTVICTTSINQ